MIVFVIPKLLPKKVSGMVLWPFLIVRNTECKGNKVFMNHERIHLRQQMELLVIFFYVWYMLEFLFRRIQYATWQEAYRNISFEREAYENEKDLDYLKRRSFWGFINFMT
jgi:hypothetical protein